MKRPTFVFEIVVGVVIVALGAWLALDQRDKAPIPSIVASPAPVAPARVAPTAPVVAPAPTQRPPILTVRDRSVLCLDNRCRRIARMADRPGGLIRYNGTPIAADAPIQLGSCTLTLSGTLACGRDAPLHVEITWGRSHAYLRAGDRLAWVDSLTWESSSSSAVHWMTAFPGGIAQLSIGYRIGCVLTRDHAVWCWSDPAKPRAIVVPAKVVEIAVTDPFALCIRTETGQVSCTRAAIDGALACDPHSIECGIGVDEDTIAHRFDPLQLVTRPFRRVDVPPAKRLVTSEYLVDISDVDLEHIYDAHAATCTIGARGEVTCFATCHGGMSRFHVTGMPPARDVRGDLDRGYAISDAGELWSWQPPRDDACTTVEVRALNTAMSTILQLGEPLYHTGPFPRWETTRCAVTRDGPRCWQTGPSNPIAIVGFDPSTL